MKGRVGMQMKNKQIRVTLMLFIKIGLAILIGALALYNNSHSNSKKPTKAVETRIADGDTAVVTRIVDGDTIVVACRVDGDTIQEKVRFIGVDAPESVHPDASRNTALGKMASDFTKKHLLNKVIRIEFDVSKRDQYGRLLAYVWSGDTMFNEFLVEHGYAKVATFPPNVKYVERFTSAQKRAREANKGLWGHEVEGVALEPPPVKSPGGGTTSRYIGNVNSKVFHRKTCDKLPALANRTYYATRKEAISAGNKACGRCTP